MTTVALQPTLDSTFPNFPEVWTCPITELKVPKNPVKNIEWRIKLFEQAEKDTMLQQDLITACSQSILFYINAFCMTFRQKEVDVKTGREIPARRPHVPFITWPVQDVAILEVCKGIDTGSDLAIEKSRDMGASWLCLMVADHYWKFRDDSQILLLSRTKEYVDKPGNAKALFQKLDYNNQWLPEWMRPPECLPDQANRTFMHLANAWNGSVIDGESTTEQAARGDRRLFILMDEFGAVQNGRAMRKATADVTPCRIINSTPKAGSEYSTWVTSGKIKVIQLPWWEHPQKGYGRRAIQDSDTKKWKITSPWYEREEERRSPYELASELDMNHFESGSLFFEPTVLTQHKALFVRPPSARYEIAFLDQIADAAIPRIIQGRDLGKIRLKTTVKQTELKIWTALIDGRPDQSKTYTIGCDISKGQGSSNSVASIRCDQTGEKIGELATANLQPYEFARKVVAIAVWVGGANPRRLPYINWEANGPGWDFGKIVVKTYKYPFYYKDKKAGTTNERESSSYGWHNSRQKKDELLAYYRRKLARGGIINYCEEALDEAGTYVYYESGGIGPAFLMEETEGARATHGDRVMADALTLLRDAEYVKLTHEPSRPPKGSCGERREKAMKRRKDEKSKKIVMRRSYDFREKH